MNDFLQLTLFDNPMPDNIIYVSRILKKYELCNFNESYSIWSHCPNLGYRYEAHFRCKDNVAIVVGEFINSLTFKDIEFSMYYSNLPWLDSNYPYLCHIYSIEKKKGKK